MCVGQNTRVCGWACMAWRGRAPKEALAWRRARGPWVKHERAEAAGVRAGEASKVGVLWAAQRSAVAIIDKGLAG